MRPIPYDNIDDFQSMTLTLSDGEYQGYFSSMRVDRKTIPHGLFAYDIRHDEDTWFSELKDYVLINHFGTFITHTKISNAEEGLKIESVIFNDTKEKEI